MYGQSCPHRAAASFMDSILGEIGHPLRVDNQDNEVVGDIKQGTASELSGSSVPRGQKNEEHDNRLVGGEWI